MIAYRVVAVPERLERALTLAEQVGGEVILDHHHDGRFPTHVKALLSVKNATHVVVLEDDAIVCGDFPAHVERLVRERPTHLLGLHVGRARPKKPQPIIEALIGSGEWLDDPVLTERLRWAVGYVMPVRDVPEVVDHLAQGDVHPWINTDKRIGEWHASRGRLSYPHPSPVDHDDTLPSTTNSTRGGTGRVAWAHCEGVA